MFRNFSIGRKKATKRAHPLFDYHAGNISRAFFPGMRDDFKLLVLQLGEISDAS
jgi:hypothetical protein